jgi:SAM-dependent methyltransferase
MSARKNFPTSEGSRVARSNAEFYGTRGHDHAGAPHLRHRSIRGSFQRMVWEVCSLSSKAMPTVLDLGAGEGFASLLFLKRGARVIAVDVSAELLDRLRARCEPYSSSLRVHCGDVESVLQSVAPGSVDIVVATSFLHHIPDYIALIRQCLPLIGPHGQFVSFQDPMKYESLSRAEYLFSRFAYFSWRIHQDDLLAGAKRYLRRRRGILLDNCPQDMVEYHVVRGGVDQGAIAEALVRAGFSCRVIAYFSTQSTLLQPVGSLLGVKNTFGIVAQRLNDRQE